MTKTKTFNLKALALFVCMFFMAGVMSLSAQTAARYTFTSGTGVFSSISGTGTARSTIAADDAGVNFTISPGFVVNGVTYTNVRMCSNGWLAFYVTTAPTTTTTYSPMSTTITNGAVVIVPLGGDLNINAGGMAYTQTIGTEHIFEWNNYKTFSYAGTLNFQVRLNTADGSIKFIYGAYTAPNAGFNSQVGFRTSVTPTYATDVNNLMIDATGSPNTCNWANAVTGFANASTMATNASNPTVGPTNGLTYTWTPQNVVSPVRTFTAVTGITSTSATVNWTAPTGATQYNVQYRAYGSCSWTNWSGNPVLTNSVTLTGLLFNTAYQVRVQASNGSINTIYSHIPNAAGTGSGYLAASTFTTLQNLCAGTPAPGNTLATVVSSCDGTPTTLSLQNPTAGTGVTYSWESADDIAFTTNLSGTLGTAATLVTTVPSTPKYFRCNVTCSTGPATTASNPILISPVAPNPGNTVSSVVSACPIGAFTLSLQNPVAGSANYVWQSADDATFTTNLITLATTTTPTYGLAGQASAKYYRCVVTCLGGLGTATSNGVFVSQSPANQCYCIPAYSSGIQFGDLISNVQVLGTTLSNNSGTATSPNISYTYYNPAVYTAPNYTATLTAGNTYQVSVTIGSFSGQGVSAWVDYNDDGVFSSTERIGSTPTTIGTAFGTAVFPITLSCAPVPGPHRLRIRCAWITNGPTIDPCASYGYGEAEDYIVTIAPPDPCPAPSNFSSNTPTLSGATFAWTVGCLETNWELEFGPVGFAPGTGTVEAATSNPYTATTMPCGSTLHVYLRANCLGNGYSTYVGPITVTTLACPCNGAPALANTLASVTNACSATPFTLSLSQTYTGLTGITYAWETSTNGSTWNPTSGAGATYSATQSAATYYRCVVTCSSGPVSTPSNPILVGQNPPTQCYCIPTTTYGCGDNDVIAQVTILNGTTPLYTNNSGTGCPSDPVPGNQGPNVNGPGYSDYTNLGSVANLTAGNTYNFQVFVGTYSEGFAAWIDYNDDGVFAASEKIGFTVTAPAGSGLPGVLGGSATFPVTLACNPPSGTHRLRVRCVFATAGSTIDPCLLYTYGESEDYLVTIDPALPCPAPSNFASNTPTPTGANFTWTNGCVETDWEIEFGAPGFIPGTGTIEAATSNPYTATTMLCGTTYDVYLRANCLGNGYSTYVGPISVTTGLCPCSVVNPGNTLSSATSVCPTQSFTLSLQNATAGSGVSYQWYWSLDNITYNPIGGNTATLTQTQSVPYWYYCTVTCANGPTSVSSNPVYVGSSTPTVGISQATAIPIGQLPSWTTPYTDMKNNSCYPNSYTGANAQSSGDIWYSFTLCSTSDINISLCSNTFDTYLHLLDNTGTQIAVNDDSGPLCPGLQSSISQTGLAAGTYYIVTEGFSSNTGDINIQVGTTAAATCSATLNLKCFIQGYYITDNTDPNYQKMRPALFNQIGAPYTTNDCDTITVELHDATAPYAIATGIPAFVGKLDINGNLACTFPAAAVGGNYYIALKHRNSLQTWSAAPVTIAAVTSYDFTNFSTPGPDNKSYGPNQYEVQPGIWALISGDITNDGVSDVQDGSVDAFDYTKQDPLVINGDCGYYAADLNGDGCVDAFDYVLLDPNLIIGYTINIPQ